MNALADSSGLVSLFVESDSNFPTAVKTKEALMIKSGKFFVASEVFAETINILGKKFGHSLATEVAKVISSTSIFIFVDSDEEIRSNAMRYFQKSRSDVSFTDCLVMAYADHFDTKIIFGFDKVFEENGFKLPK